MQVGDDADHVEEEHGEAEEEGGEGGDEFGVGFCYLLGDLRGGCDLGEYGLKGVGGFAGFDGADEGVGPCVRGIFSLFEGVGEAVSVAKEFVGVDPEGGVLGLEFRHALDDFAQGDISGELVGDGGGGGFDGAMVLHESP